MRRAATAAAVSLLFLAGVASAQPPGAPSAFTAEAGRVSLGAEALLWWFKGNPAPALVSDVILGQAGTKVFLGGQDVDTNPHPGFRLTAGYALTEQWAVESSIFYVPPRESSRSVSSSGQIGSKDLSIPFFDVVKGGENDTPLSAAGVHAGSATERFRDSLLGAELNAAVRVPMGGGLRVDGLGGFRYMRLRETYTFSTSSPDVPPRPPDVFETRDEFDTTNNFFGLQVGARARARWGSLFLNGMVKLALGPMVESVDVDGRLITNDFNQLGPPQTFAGGYFALPTNIGDRTRTVFAVVPEAGLTLGYQLTPQVSVFGGYTFLYASNVVRAPRQINRDINPSQAPAISGDPPGPVKGPAEPSFRFKSSDFWAQGLSVGLAFRF
jgi:hypothetical protein